MHPYINHVIKTAERNKETKKTKKNELIEQLKARAQNEKPQSSKEQFVYERDNGLLIKLQEDNRELRKHIKKLENRINEQAQKIQMAATRSGRLEAENKQLRTSLYEANTEWKKEKNLSLEKQANMERLLQKHKALDATQAHTQNQLEKVKSELARTQALTDTNSNSYRNLGESINQLKRANRELSLQLQTEKQMRQGQNELEIFKQTIRAQATYIRELKISQSGLISEAGVQELYGALREKLVLAKPSHKKMLLDLFNRLKKIKRRFYDASRQSNHLETSKILYGYVMKTGNEYHFYSLDNGVFRVHQSDHTLESDLPVKAEIIHDYEVKIVKQYTYHYVPRRSSLVSGGSKITVMKSMENVIVPVIPEGIRIRVLIIGSKNRTKYTNILSEYGFIIDWYDGYEESPEVLKSKREGVQVVIICTGHSPHFVLDLFHQDDPRVEKVYRENVNSINHRIRYNAIKQGLL